MEIKGSNIPRTLNPSNPLREEAFEKEPEEYLVDLDGTLAEYSRWKGKGHIGEPILKMKNKILDWIKEGKTVKIFTARAENKENIPIIRKWLLGNGFPLLEITNKKTIKTTYIFDDRAREVLFNTGIIIDKTGKL